MVMTLSEVYARVKRIREALDIQDWPTARFEANRLEDFLQNAHIIPVLTTEQNIEGGHH